ncbi:hypothetical protein HY251_06925 [bacterium]|nr:hypothetical protein [bacterium]
MSITSRKSERNEAATNARRGSRFAGTATSRVSVISPFLGARGFYFEREHEHEKEGERVPTPVDSPRASRYDRDPRLKDVFSVGHNAPAENREPGGPGQLLALVELLADESPRVRAAAEGALARAGTSVASLRSLAEAIDDPGRRARARARVEALRLASVERELAVHMRTGEPDLETGAFLLARSRCT